MASSDTKKSGRFAGLRRAAENIEAGTIGAPKEEKAPAPKEEPRQSTAKPTSSLKERLSSKQSINATIRMSLDLPPEMHEQVGRVAAQAGIPKAEVVREILRETLPELLDS